MGTRSRHEDSQEVRMRLVTATLIKRKTADGQVEMNDDVPLGRTYEIDLDTLAYYDAYNGETGQVHNKIMVEHKDGGLIPVELLRIPGLQMPACTKCTQGVMDQDRPGAPGNDHLYGRCPCACHTARSN